MTRIFSLSYYPRIIYIHYFLKVSFLVATLFFNLDNRFITLEVTLDRKLYKDLKFYIYQVFWLKNLGTFIRTNSAQTFQPTI